MIVAAVQMSSQLDVGENLARARELVRQARGAGAELVLLPENFAYLGGEEGKRAIAESLDEGGPIVTMLRETARAERLWLLGGGMPEKSSDPLRPYNSCVVFDPEGTLRGRYRKIHLFDVDVGDGVAYRESAATMPGSEPVACDAAGARVGLSVCYDVRFPELYRRLVDLGAEVLVVPAAFTLTTGKDHWRTLLCARAIESQAWVIAAAQWGKHGQRMTYGKSCVIDPWGDVVAQASEGEGFALARIDLADVERVRAKLPSLKHRVL